MRLTLIVPPSSFLLDELVFPALGVLKVAAALRGTDVDVDVLDLAGETNPADRVLVRGSDAYGITATMPQMPAAAAIAREIRARAPKARLILGGPHVTLMNASARLEQKTGTAGRATRAMEELGGLFDVLVCGDGERAILPALRPSAPRVIDADDPASTLFLTKEDLDHADVPARHLIDLGRYRYQIDGERATSCIFQLGCPFNCQFCGGRNSPFLRRVRIRSTASVLDEIRHLYERYGYKAFMAFDDELNVSRTFLELLDGLVTLQDDLGVEFRFRGLLKSELLTDAMALKMYAAGFRQVLVGFESGHPRILENMEKRATRDQNTRCVETLQARGLKVKALMSIGHAGESAETVQTTKDWLLAVRPDDFDATIITVYPGTPYWDKTYESAPGLYTYAAKNGDRLHGRHIDQLTDVGFYKGVPHSYQSFVHTDYLSGADLVTLRDDLEDDVRRRLNIPYPSAVPALQFDHSMGMQ
jgi:anaerobic magnesium-protoporphyrin IX monomethyl ester cyclase